MKKVALLLLLLCSLIGVSEAQLPNLLQATTFTSVTSGTAVKEIGSGISFHQIKWTVSGTMTTCTVAVDTSIDGISWNAGGLITGTSCTSIGNSVVTTGQANYVRVNVTAISGAGATVNVTYLAWVSNSISANGTLLIGQAFTDTDTATNTATLLNQSCCTGLVVYPHFFSGVSGQWPRQFLCDTTITQTVSATTTQLVAGASGKKIRVCSIVSTRTDVAAVVATGKLVEGTGANCGTGQTNLTGQLAAFPSGAVGSITSALGNAGPFITNVTADALCYTEAGAASSIDVTISYSQY